MRYLCLVYFEGKALASLSENEKVTLDRESLAYDEDLVRSGHFIEGEALQSTSSAVTVRVRNGKISATDGPFAETREQLGGFILVEARDLNEAIQVASKIPLAKLGSIEVRPVWILKRSKPK
jgi:hypothetical protein